MLRNLSRKTHLIAWSLSTSLLLILLLLIIFLSILLVANSWVNQGVSEGGGAVETVLPELVRLRSESVSQVSNITRNDLHSLRKKLHDTILR